ncbi:MAG: hypothetical protein WBZ48_09840 [Bacteroidota bacterium]
MTPPTASAAEHLSSVSLRHIKEIEKIFFNAGLGESAPLFFAPLEAQLSRSADDTMASTNFLRFIEGSFNRATILRDLSEHPVLLETLLSLFGASQYFSDILIRDPELFRWLTATNILEQSKTQEEFFATSRQSVQPFQSHSRKLNVLKRYQRRELLRIGVRDLLGLADLETTTRELSHLADAITALVAELSWSDLKNQYGAEPKTPWAIIGLGKLGGEELNYSSDIDIIAIYNEEGEMKLSSALLLTHSEFFVRFIEHVVHSLSHPTEEGYFYRVDMRLRPDGKAGTLIRSYQSAIAYYESRGELWERQMLIKARHVAGSEPFTQQFLGSLSPFIYPRTFFENPIEEISRIKTRIESDSDGRNIKLRAGGIRDIEFTVQALQLLNGGKNSSLRNANTLAAIALLHTARLLSATEAARLRDAYVFFRILEHRLQMLEYTQTHSLPVTKRDRKKIAVRMSMTPERFEKLLVEHLENVRLIFNSVFAATPLQPQSTVERFVTEKPGSEFSREFAIRYGLGTGEKTLRIIRRMMYGSNLLGKKEYTERTRTLFKAIAEPLLEEIGTSIAPERALAHCERIFSSLSSPDGMYSLCSGKNFRKSLVSICTQSGMLANQFALAPGLAETILTGVNTILRNDTERFYPTNNIHEWKISEESKAAVRYILGDADESALFRSLSEIAAAILSFMYKEERRKLKIPKTAQFCIIGLGKLGGQEMNFGSDLDVVFLYGAARKSEAEKCEELAAKIITASSRMSPGGKLYDIDARLRPEGRNAPLAVAEKQYLEYLQQRASLWERQSLTRARVIVGDKGFSTEVMQSLHDSVYQSRLPNGWAEEIFSMRRKTESRSRTSTSEFLDIKLGSGGLMDVEFAIQALQLSRGKSAFPSTNTYDLLELYSHEASHARTITSFANNYRLLRRVETALRLGLDVKTHIIPADDESLDYLARLLQYHSIKELLLSVHESMRETRSLFESILASLK